MDELTVVEARTLLARAFVDDPLMAWFFPDDRSRLHACAALFGLFARLDRAIDFEALDGQPVDLVFLLLAPEGAGADHLKALARVARLLRDQDVARKLRDSRDAEAMFAVLTLPPASAA